MEGYLLNEKIAAFSVLGSLHDNSLKRLRGWYLEVLAKSRQFYLIQVSALWPYTYQAYATLYATNLFEGKA